MPVSLEVALASLRGDRRDVARTLTAFGVTRGIMNDGCYCPVATYLTERTGGQVEVSNVAVRYIGSGVRRALPDGVRGFICDFDLGMADYFPADVAQTNPLSTPVNITGLVD